MTWFNESVDVASRAFCCSRAFSSSSCLPVQPAIRPRIQATPNTNPIFIGLSSVCLSNAFCSEILCNLRKSSLMHYTIGRVGEKTTTRIVKCREIFKREITEVEGRGEQVQIEESSLGH